MVICWSCLWSSTICLSGCLGIPSPLSGPSSFCFILQICVLSFPVLFTLASEWASPPCLLPYFNFISEPLRAEKSPVWVVYWQPANNSNSLLCESSIFRVDCPSQSKAHFNYPPRTRTAYFLNLYNPLFRSIPINQKNSIYCFSLH